MEGEGMGAAWHGMAWHGPGWLLQASENSWPGAGTHQDVREKTVLLDQQEPEMRRRLQKAGPLTSLSIVLPSSIGPKGRLVGGRPIEEETQSGFIESVAARPREFSQVMTIEKHRFGREAGIVVLGASSCIAVHRRW